MKSRLNKLEYNVIIDKYNIAYYKNNKFHRDKDLPAEIWKDGFKVWYKNGLEHRDNGKPSIIYPDGRMDWYENGKFIKNNFNEI